MRALGDVAEVRRDDRVERLADQPLDVAEPLHDAGGLLVVDMQHQRHRQQGLVAVGGDQRDAHEVLVILVFLDHAGDPPQHEVDRRHQLHLQGVWVQRVLARRQRHLPHAAMPGLDLLAVAERHPAEVLALGAEIRYHHAHVADGDHRFRTQLDRGEPAVDEERAVGEHLELLAPPSAQGQERLGVLEVVVVLLAGRGLHLGRDDLARADGRAVMNADHADVVALLAKRHAAGRIDLRRNPAAGRAVADHDRVEPAHGQQLGLPGAVLRLVVLLDRPAVGLALGNHHEQRHVDRVDALAQEAPLPAALALVVQERRSVLEVVAVDHLAQRLRRRQRLAVAGVDVADLAFGDRHQPLLVQPVLPGEIAKMQSAAQQPGLEARLSGSGDDPPTGERAPGGPELLHNAHAIVGDVANAQEPQQHQQARPGDSQHPHRCVRCHFHHHHVRLLPKRVRTSHCAARMGRPLGPPSGLATHNRVSFT